MKRLILALILASLALSCSRPIGNYSLSVKPAVRYTVKQAVQSKPLTEMLLDTLIKAHPELAKRDTLRSTDTIYVEAKQERKEQEAKVTYSPEEVLRLRKDMETLMWNKLDSMKIKLSDSDPFVKTVAREAIPIMESGKVNTDTARLDMGDCHAFAYMYKGKVILEGKRDRSAIEVHNQINQTNIKPTPSMRACKTFWDFWQAWLITGLLTLSVGGWFIAAIKK